MTNQNKRNQNTIINKKGVVSMKSIKKAVVGLLVAVTMVTPVFAQDLRLKQNPIPDYNKTNQWAGYDLVDGQAAGTRTVYDIIIKDGTTFVNAEEFAQAMDLYLHKHSWVSATEDKYYFTAKILDSDYTNELYSLELDFEVAKTGFTLNGSEPTQIMIDGEYYDTTKATFENHYLPVKISPWETAETADAYTRQGTFTIAPFKKDGKIYVPLKALVQALNINKQTPIAYNSVNKSVTFQKDFMYKHYVFNGTITDRNYYDWNASY